MAPKKPDPMAVEIKPMEDMDETGDMTDKVDADEELMDMVCDEFLEAIEKKDKTAMKDALRALVMSCKE